MDKKGTIRQTVLCVVGFFDEIGCHEMVINSCRTQVEPCPAVTIVLINAFRTAGDGSQPIRGLLW